MKIDRDALPWSAVLGLLAAGLGLFVHWLAAVPPLLLLLFILWFLRDPERIPPDDPRALVSPADGRIIKAGPDVISIFMNVFDVHVCRAPLGGSVERVERRPGRFLAAYRDEASQYNERLSIQIADGERRLRFTLVAGLIARRIVCRVKPGDRLAAGQRVGLIRFGSRVDLEMPAGGEVTVALGRKVAAGETVVARLPADSVGSVGPVDGRVSPSRPARSGR